MPEEVAKPGRFVSLTYSIVDDERKVVGQSDLPVSYVFGGETEMLGGMEQAMQGKKSGDSVWGSRSAPSRASVTTIRS